jgi:hypothetical protein
MPCPRWAITLKWFQLRRLEARPVSRISKRVSTNQIECTRIVQIALWGEVSPLQPMRSIVFFFFWLLPVSGCPARLYRYRVAFVSWDAPTSISAIQQIGENTRTAGLRY